MSDIRRDNKPDIARKPKQLVSNDDRFVVVLQN